MQTIIKAITNDGNIRWVGYFADDLDDQTLNFFKDDPTLMTVELFTDPSEADMPLGGTVSNITYIDPEQGQVFDVHYSSNLDYDSELKRIVESPDLNQMSAWEVSRTEEGHFETSATGWMPDGSLIQ